MSLEKGHGVFAIRYPHQLLNTLETMPSLTLSFGKWRFLSEPKAGLPTIIAVGPEGWELMERLRSSSFEGGLVNPLFLNPIDPEGLRRILVSSDVFIYDPYATSGGFAESLSAALGMSSYSGKTHLRAVPNAFVFHASTAEQETLCGVSVDQAFQDIVSLFPKK
jgi:deoxyxylulose-5-phosphate synthase